MYTQRRAALTAEITFLRQLICPLVWGLKRETIDEEGTVIKQIKPTCNSQTFTTKELLQAKLNDRHERLPRLANSTWKITSRKKRHFTLAVITTSTTTLSA